MSIKGFLKEIYTFYFNFDSELTDLKVFENDNLFINNSDIFIHRKRLHSNFKELCKRALSHEIDVLTHIPKDSYYIGSCSCVGCVKPTEPTCKRLDSLFKVTPKKDLIDCCLCLSKFTSNEALVLHYSRSADCEVHFFDSKSEIQNN